MSSFVIRHPKRERERIWFSNEINSVQYYSKNEFDYSRYLNIVNWLISRMYLVLIEFDYSINLIHLNELILKEFEHLEWNYLINEEYVMMLNSSMNLNSSIDY